MIFQAYVELISYVFDKDDNNYLYPVFIGVKRTKTSDDEEMTDDADMNIYLNKPFNATIDFNSSVDNFVYQLLYTYHNNSQRPCVLELNQRFGMPSDRRHFLLPSVTGPSLKEMKKNVTNYIDEFFRIHQFK